MLASKMELIGKLNIGYINRGINKECIVGPELF